MTAHTMSMTARCKDGIGFEDVRAALLPFFAYWGKSFDGDLRGFTFDDASGMVHIFSEGDVTPDYLGMLQALAPTLTAISPGGEIAYQAGDDTHRIPFGNADKVSAKIAFDAALKETLATLASHLSPEKLEVLAQTADNLFDASGAATKGISVRHWNSEYYGGDLENYDEFRLRMADQRASNGQLFLDLEPATDDFDAMSAGMLSITMEVNSFGKLPPVACSHIHFDGDSLAFSLFKAADHEFYLRPESGVTIQPTTYEGEQIFVVKQD